MKTNILEAMRSHLIACNVLVLFASGFGLAQEKSQYLFLEKCSEKHPAPCADKAPKAIYAPDPRCTERAERAHVVGIVVLRVGVGADGLVHHVQLVKSLGYGLDEEAVKAVTEWRFTPGESSGKAAPVEIRVESSFVCPR